MSIVKALSLDSRHAKTSVFTPEQWPATTSSSINFYDGSFSDYLNIYRTQPAVRQVVQFIAENTAQVPLKVYKRVGSDNRKQQDSHPLQLMLNFPNPSMSRYEFLRDLVTDLEVFDCTFWQIVKLDGREYAFRMYPDAVEIIKRDAFGPSRFKQTKADGSTQELDRSEVLYLRGYGGERGISALETLKRILQEDQAAGAYREGMYRTGMRNAGVIERPLDAPDWSPAARERFLEQLTSRHTGATASGRPLLLEEGMTWKSDQISTRSEEYVAGREFTVRAVANAYRISPALLGLTDAPYASITEYNRQLYQNALASKLTFISEAIERQRLSVDELERERIYVEFNLDAKLRGSFAERAAIAQIAVGQPYMTVDEWRALDNMPPLTDEQRAELLGVSTDTPGPDAVEGVFDQPAPSEDAGTLDTPKSGSKARDRGAVARRNKHAQDIFDALEKTVVRVVAAADGGSKGMKAERWSREIAKDVRPLFERIVTAEGTRKFQDFDPAQTEHYLDSGAERIGDNFAGKIDEANERHNGDASLIKTALVATAARVAQGQASHLMSFAREEAGRQGGASKKTWSVTSNNSRHPEMDGESVALGKTFSNGLAYPGDPSADAEDVAGCTCVLDIS